MELWQLSIHPESNFLGYTQVHELIKVLLSQSRTTFALRGLTTHL